MTLRIQHNVALQDLTTLAVPATAEHFYHLAQAAELPELLECAHQSGWRLRVLGEGSNLVLGSQLDGLLIQQCCCGIELLEEDEDSVLLAVAGGESWHDFVQWCLARGYFGLENLALIPGTVGAAPIQNIGAYGVEAGAFIESVHARSLATGEHVALTGEQCQFGYRDSVFKQALRDQLIIEAVHFRLPKIPATQTDYPVLARYLAERGWLNPDPHQVFRAVVAIRSARLPDPYEVPNAGSFFKNPQVSAQELETLVQAHPGLPHYPDQQAGRYKLAAAWLIEDCGFKQRTEGAVQVHPDHALVIINPLRRPAREILGFAGEIADAVEARFGIRLEQEPRSYG